jgi:hypothetical protein
MTRLLLCAARLVRMLLPLVTTAASSCEYTDDAVRTEIVPLAEGEYHGARWGGTQVERFYSVAWKGPPDAPDGSAVIVSPEHEQPCNLGTTVSRYTSLRPQTASKYVIGSPSPARVSLLEEVDDAGFGTLRFADIDCQRIDLSVPDVDKGWMWYVYEPDQTRQKLAVRDRNGTIIFVDPWAQEQHEVAHGVDGKWFKPFESGEWLIEDEQLVKLDLEGKELSRIGSKVAGFFLLSGKGDVAYQDEGGIHTIRSGVSKRITKNGCLYLGSMDAFIPTGIGYFDEPCDSSSKFHVAVGTDKTYTYSTGISGIVQSVGMMVYTAKADDKTQVWLVQAGAPTKPKMIGEFPTFQLEQVITLPSRAVVLVSREAGENRTRTVWELQPAGDSFTLMELTRGLVGWSRAESSLALLYESGDLVLADGSIDRVTLRVPNALSSRFTFIMGGKALALVYLDHVDETTLLGSLELHLVSGAHYTLAAGDVREFEYVYWPERGIEYTTGGSDPGIRFVRIDIPCEATSDAPWACGF